MSGECATARVWFDEPQEGVSPGQAAVFYRGDEVIGGGWIRESLNGENDRHHRSDKSREPDEQEPSCG